MKIRVSKLWKIAHKISKRLIYNTTLFHCQEASIVVHTVGPNLKTSFLSIFFKNKGDSFNNKILEIKMFYRLVYNFLPSSDTREWFSNLILSHESLVTTLLAHRTSLH